MPALAQINAVRVSEAKSISAHDSCHPAAAIDMLNMAMLVREKRVSTISIANRITTAAVAAAGIAKGEK
ncbi:MAG: hypothetical protein NVSMB68_08150 [Thermoanaerobaculia bacterium]